MDDHTLHNIENVAGLIGVGALTEAHRQGRTQNGHLFSAPPPDDPLYIPATIGGIWILHFIWLPLLTICTVPVLIVGALPFVGICAGVHLLNHYAYIAAIIISLLLYGKYIVWRLVILRIIGGLFRKLF